MVIEHHVNVDFLFIFKVREALYLCRKKRKVVNFKIKELELKTYVKLITASTVYFSTKTVWCSCTRFFLIGESLYLFFRGIY